MIDKNIMKKLIGYSRPSELFKKIICSSMN